MRWVRGGAEEWSRHAPSGLAAEPIGCEERAGRLGVHAACGRRRGIEE